MGKSIGVWLVLMALVFAGWQWAQAAKWRQPFPETGDAIWFIDMPSGVQAPLAIEAPEGSPVPFVVILEDWSTGDPVVQVPVRAGEVAELTMPLGRYRMKTIKGFSWEGPERMFRFTTGRKEALHPLDFSRVGLQIQGKRIQLETPMGNMETRDAWWGR